jgi:hypothetical protein
VSTVSCRHVRTLAVFSVDDDVRIDGWAIQSAFYAWLQDTSRMVGFVVTARGGWPASIATQLGAVRLNAMRISTSVDVKLFEEAPDDELLEGADPNHPRVDMEDILDARSARLADVILLLEQAAVLTHTADDNTTYTPDDLEFLEDILRKANATGTLPPLPKGNLETIDDDAQPDNAYDVENELNSTEGLQPVATPSMRVASLATSPRPQEPSPTHQAAESLRPETWMYLRCMSFNVTKYTPEGCSTRKNSMNVVLTGGAIFHKLFLELYDSSCGGHAAFVAAKTAVDHAYNGEDLLFSFFHAWLTGKGPWVVQSNQDKLLSAIPGLSKRQGHYAKRAELLQQFASVFGNVTLRPSRGVVWNDGILEGVPCPDK